MLGKFVDLRLKKALIVTLVTALLVQLLLLIASTEKAYASSYAPINSNASSEARDLLAYLYSLEGNGILSGQHEYIENPDTYANEVNNMTGLYPAVHGYEMGAISGQTPSQLANQRQALVNSAIDWHNNGGIVTMMYHMNKPGTGYCWSGCVQPAISQTEFDNIITPGTTEYQILIQEIDLVADYLKQLRDENVPVLWRPFHEMNGGWFWWGQQPNYWKLWDIMYDRYTNHHGLNNLIWVWNANAPNSWAHPYSTYFPGLHKVDVLAVDIYNNDYQQSYHDDLWALGEGKVIAIGESGEHPDPAVLSSTQNKYRWFMTWGSYLTNNNSTAATQSLYIHPWTYNRDEVNIVPGSGSSGSTLNLDDSVTGTGINQFEYSGSWNTSTGTGKYNGGDHYSLTTNSYYQVDFTGNQVKLYGSKDAHHGIAAVSIDGGAEVDVDFYGATRSDNALLWTSPVLSLGNHTIKVRVKGTKHANSTGYVVTADRVAISPGTVKTLNDASTGTGLNQFEYAGTWSTSAGTGKWNGDDHYTVVSNSYYQVDFNGTQVKLYGSKDAHHGIAAVSIDGGPEVDVDFYSAARSDQALLWTSPVLSAGNHTVKVRAKGTKHASSTGIVITADRVDVISP